MPSNVFAIPSSGPLAPGGSQGFHVLGLTETAVAVVTAVAPARTQGAILAIENLRVASTKNASGDPIHSVLCDVKNVGSVTVPSYKVNVALLTP